MKKIIAFFIVGAFIFLQLTAFARGITVSTSEEYITLTVEMSADYAGKEIGIEVIRPTKSHSNITDNQTTTISSVFEYIGQKTADENGKAVFTVEPRADAAAGYYNAYASCKGIMIEADDKFPFAPKGAVEALILSLEAAEATDSTIADVFIDPTNPEELAGFEILGLTELDEYDIYTGSDYGSAQMQSRVHTLLCKALKGQNYTKTQVQNAFAQSVYLSIVYTEKQASKLKTFLELYPEQTGLSAATMYAGVYNSGDYFSDEEKEKVALKLVSYSWTDETTEEISKIIDECIFMTAVEEISDGYGKIGEFITLGTDILKQHGADFTNYETCTKESVWRTVSGKETMPKFVEALNSAIIKYQITTSGSSTNPGPSNDRTESSVFVSGSSGSSGSVKPVTDRTAFSDIYNVKWAEEAILELYKKGIIEGKSKGLFYPDDFMKRSEFLKVLMLALSLSDSTAQADFEDVPKDSWYYPYVASAYTLGVVYGYGNYFAPDNTITREEAATMIHRCMGIVEKELAEVKTEVAFEDFDSVSEYAQNAVSELYKSGIINGISETHFSPKTNITRAQAVKMIYGLLGVVLQEG